MKTPKGRETGGAAPRRSPSANCQVPYDKADASIADILAKLK